MHQPLNPPAYPPATNEVIEAVRLQLTSGQWVRLEGCPELESAWQAFQQTDHQCWFLASGTAAIQAALLGHGLQPGDQVVTTPYTWGATVSALLQIGLVPVFADIDYQTGQLDPQAVANAITPQTRAILTVHLFGTPSPTTELRQIAGQHNILLVEDASQAHGATINQQRVGNIGHASAFSTMGLKPLGATEGGLVQFADPQAAENAFLNGKHPRGIDPERIEVLRQQGLLDSLQFGWRPSPISAAILLARLPHLDAENAARRANARYLREQLRPVKGVTLPEEPPHSEPVYHLLSFLFDERFGERELQEIRSRARECHLPLFPYIPVPIHHMKRLDPAGYEGPPVLWHQSLRDSGISYRSAQYPNAEKRCRFSLEMAWNWIREDTASMDLIAEKFQYTLNTL